MTNTTNTPPLQRLFRILMSLAIAVYAGFAAFLWYETMDDTRNDLTYLNSFLANAVRTTLKNHELILRGLGTELIVEGALEEPEKGRLLIERMKMIDPGMVGFGLARPDGQLVLVSNIDSGKPLPNLTQHDKSEASFRETLASDHLRTGRPYYFDVLDGWVVPIRVTIRDQQGAAQAVMAAGYSIENATTAWSNVTLLPHVTVALLGDDGYLRYGSPLPQGQRDEVLSAIYGSPASTEIRQQISAIEKDESFLEIFLPYAGGENYISYSRIPEYALHTGAFIPRSVVIVRWLEHMLWPTILMALFVIGGMLAYRRANQEQTRSDAAIRSLSAWQQAVLDSAGYCIISTNTNGAIVSVNKAAQRMLGYAPAELVGNATPVIFHEQDEIQRRAAELSSELGMPIEPGFETLVAKARNGEIDEHEWTFVRKDGSRFPAQLSIAPLSAPDDNIIGFVGIAEDLSEHKAIQSVLRDSESRYRSLFENAGDAIFLMRGETFVDCNPAALELFGCSREQIIGETPMRFSPATQPDGRSSEIKGREMIETAFSGQTQLFEWSHQSYGGSLFDAEVTLNVVDIAGEPHLLTSVRDISARKRSEAELHHSRLALIEHNESLRLINHLAQRLHGSLNLEEILHETIQALLGLSKAPHVAIYLVDADLTQLHLAASHGFPPSLMKLGSTLPIQGSLTGLALSQGNLLEISDINRDERLYSIIRTALSALGIRSGIVIPLFYQQSPLGSINLIYEDSHNFGQIEKETLVSLGNTVALAISNARHMDDLAFQARHDSLTGLANRTMLHEIIRQKISIESKTTGDSALLLLDLDRFKEINDTLGHEVGDQVLIQVGQRLQQLCVGHAALASRLGGDEFAIFLYEGEVVVDMAITLARNMIDALYRPFAVQGIELALGASIGIAYYPQHGTDSHALLRAADVAMYHSKKRSAGVIVYDSHFDVYSTERLTLANELIHAIDNQELVLHYQPKIDVMSGIAIGYEALVRWNHPRLGLLYPDSFIHLVEMSEVVHPFTHAVIELAVGAKRQLHEIGHYQPVAINLSALNLTDLRCITSLEQAISANKMPPEEIELELTETALMQEADNALIVLQRFNEMGVNIAVDDFGIGYSSLSYLRRLPVKALKIDQSFVKGMLNNRQDSTIVRSTISLAHNLDLKVIAEGVEDAATLALLRDMGCDQAQGFGICRPQPLDELIEWLSENIRLS